MKHVSEILEEMMPRFKNNLRKAKRCFCRDYDIEKDPTEYLCDTCGYFYRLPKKPFVVTINHRRKHKHLENKNMSMVDDIKKRFDEAVEKARTNFFVQVHITPHELQHMLEIIEAADKIINEDLASAQDIKAYKEFRDI